MKKYASHIAFALGALTVLWVAAAVASTHLLVLAMTALIGAVYVFGALELRHYRATTAELHRALLQVPESLQRLDDWLHQVPASLQQSVRQRIEGERNALPGPVLTPYLVGLLVMLGMLGTFLGMVVTLNGAVFALEGTNSVQGMRAAFSEPIRGLGLAFGTSVAGVATSAMLGLMSSLSRRDRALASQALDVLVHTRLRPFSLAHQRLLTFQALQQQTDTLPVVVQQLQSLMTQMERHHLALGERLLANQEGFHRDVKSAYTDLALAVDATMRSSLSQSVQLASEGIRPVVHATLADMAQQAQSIHERSAQSTREQLEALGRQFGTAWDAQQARQAEADGQRLLAWKTALQDMADTLQSQWHSAGAQTLAQQQQICDTLAHTAQTVSATVTQQAQQTLVEMEHLSTRHEELLQARLEAEAQAAERQSQQAQALASLLRTELSTLREQEAQRGEAAVARLAQLQSTVTQHLTTLGQALERPIARLIETASEAPRAAAEVIGQLRQEISVSVARDNALLEERTRILGTLSTLMDAINHASNEQRGVIDALVSSSQNTLAQASAQFKHQVATENGKLAEAATQVTASAVDVASLGETLAFAVRSFNDTSDKLMTSLQGIETAIAQSMARSDEQLAYYVAQAREIIDLSISSQKDVLEALEQRQAHGVV